VLFAKQFWEPIASGVVTVTYRRWKRPQAVAGHRYRTAAGILEVTAVDEVLPSELSDADARLAGYPDAERLLADLRGDPDLPITRVRFRTIDEPDPRQELAADDDLSDDDVAAIDGRLRRLDAASSHGAWTAETLRAVAANPGVRAAELAASLGRERAPFKLDVRKLKALGLTLSLEVGYRISPRGAAYLDRRA
jgi:hypothetical protein